MRTRFAKFIAVLAALHLLGGHWLAIQGVAWVTMLVDHSQEASLGEAIEKTFDGKHPCPLCKAVASGQNEERERQDDLADPGSKLIAVLAVEAPAPPRPFSKVSYFPRSVEGHSVDAVLPSPPPRAA